MGILGKAALVAMFASSALLVGCDNKEAPAEEPVAEQDQAVEAGTMEEMGEAMDDAMADAEASMEEMGEEMDEAMDDAEASMEEMGEEMKDAAAE